MPETEPNLSNLQRARENAGMTLEEVAEELDMALSTYHQKECGMRRLWLEEARKLACLFDTRIDKLFYSKYYGKISTDSLRYCGDVDESIN